MVSHPYDTWESNSFSCIFFLIFFPRSVDLLPSIFLVLNNGFRVDWVHNCTYMMSCHLCCFVLFVQWRHVTVSDEFLGFYWNYNDGVCTFDQFTSVMAFLHQKLRIDFIESVFFLLFFLSVFFFQLSITQLLRCQYWF